MHGRWGLIDFRNHNLNAAKPMKRGTAKAAVKSFRELIEWELSREKTKTSPAAKVRVEDDTSFRLALRKTFDGVVQPFDSVLQPTQSWGRPETA